jgi:hypothetical protein
MWVRARRTSVAARGSARRSAHCGSAALGWIVVRARIGGLGARRAGGGSWHRRIMWVRERTVLDPDDAGVVGGAFAEWRQAVGEDVLGQVDVGVLVPDGVAEFVVEAAAAAELHGGPVCGVE